jgi:hypothetical protein
MSTQKLLTLSLTPLARKAEKPESEKFTHDEVGYENPSTHGTEDCDDCIHFIAATKDSPSGCEGVQRPIAEEAWCHRFERKRQPEPSYKMAYDARKQQEKS